MPTPHGSRGGMAFSADELRVLRRALAQVLHPAQPAPSMSPQPSGPAPASLLPVATAEGWARAAWAEDVQDVLRLAESIDEAVDEAGRMRAFALADLARYRHALPGSASGYLDRLEDAIADGYVPAADDLSALRSLTALPCAQQERGRRLRLRSRSAELAEGAVRRRLEPPGARHGGLALEAGARPPAPQPPSAAAASAVGNPAVGNPAVGNPAADNVAEFARPSRPPRPRDQSRPADPASGGYSRPLPTRRGGPIPMAPFAATPGSQPTPRPADGAPEDTDREDEDKPEQQEPQPPRHIPTPGDLWPRGVRRRLDGEAELATG